MISLDKFLDGMRKEMGEEKYQHRLKIADVVFERVEDFLRSDEGKDLEPDTEAAVSFYKIRIKVLALSLLSEDLVVRLGCMDGLVALRAIQELVKEGKMT